MLLQDKVAIVTGAASGIGYEVALAYARAGARVVLSDINDAAGLALVERIRSEGGTAHYVPCNVRQLDDHQKLVDNALEHYGRLDIACNNAGIPGARFPLADYPVDLWHDAIDINLTGVFFGMRAQIPALIANGGGAIVNIASVAARITLEGTPAYTAAKHGVAGLTKSAALDYSAQNIRVNAVLPGLIKTPLIAEILDDVETRKLEALHPIGRLGKPGEIAEAVLWLSSAGASFVTGACLNVDGGYLTR